jgi:hypothetical protein
MIMRYIVNSNNITEEPKEKYPQHQEIKCYNRKKKRKISTTNKQNISHNELHD